ncbi:MAG TPA: nitrilase-related carbon-nitrogen hydrolase [Anaerolineales bacterium]|nr:nitrilase-related carbon-nitrogen hydrolase [Anaerolineales bacterium]
MSHYLFLLIAFALNFVASGGKWNVPIAAWIAPIFVLRFYRQSEKPWLDFLLLWLATAIPLIVSWKGATFFPGLGEIGFFLAVAPIALIAVVTDRYFHVRFPDSAWMLFIFPIAATALDFFQANGSPFGTFGASAYSQRGFLPVMQIASVTGIWGITFAMSLFASTVNRFWEGNASPLSWASAGLLVLILGLSLGRTLLPTQPKQTAVIAGFSLPEGTLSKSLSQFKSGDEAGFRQAMDELHAAELNQIRTLAQDGANIVVIQEGGVIGMTDQIEKMIADAGTLAKEENIYVVLPTFDIEQTPPVNSIYIVDPNGDVVLHHIKYGGNMFEGTLKGDGVLQTVDTPYGKLSAIICWDADFPNIVKQAGSQNVDLLIVPAQDWLGVRDIHAGMATFRAVENGLTVFRQTGQGVSLVSDPYGKVLNLVDSFEDTEGKFVSIQKVSAPIGSLNTLYPKLGDALGNAMLLGLVGSLVGLWKTRKRPTRL